MIDEKEGLIKKVYKEEVIEEDKNQNKPKFIFKATNNMNNYKDNNDFYSNYDAILLKNLSNKIESIIQNKPANEGMGEISNNLMSSIIASKSKKNKGVKKIKKIKVLNPMISDANKLNKNKVEKDEIIQNLCKRITELENKIKENEKIKNEQINKSSKSYDFRC